MLDVSVKERVEEVLKLATRGRLVTEVDRNTALTSLSSIRIVCMHVELCMSLNRRAMHVNLLACVSLLDCHDGLVSYSGRGTVQGWIVPEKTVDTRLLEICCR